MASPSKRPITLKNRDFVLLRGLFESRVFTLQQATALFFDGKNEVAKKRVQKLKRAGLIAERPRRPYHPSVLFLTRPGFRRLRDEGKIQDYPSLNERSFEKRARVSELTLKHELQVGAVKAALSPVIEAAEGWSVAEFTTWPYLLQFEARFRDEKERRTKRVTVKPDGYMRFHESEDDGSLYEHLFFLEVDRSTEPQRTLGQRAACYRDYYQSGGLAARHGASREAYRDYPFRVLYVLQNTERRNNTAERLLQMEPPVLNQVWLTTFEEVTQSPLDAIWITPKGYREVTEGTEFDPERRRFLTLYKRQPEREEMVEQAISKSALLV